MALASVRVENIVSKQSEKPVAPNVRLGSSHSVSAAAGNNVGASLAPEGLSREQSPEPSRAVAARQDRPGLGEPTVSMKVFSDVSVDAGSAATDDAGEQSATAASTASVGKAGPPPPFMLDSCPSFQEQHGTKPVFFDRHATFKRLRDESLSRVSEEEPAVPAAAVPASSSAARCPYLPDWSIARSGVWALAEAGLIRAMESADREDVSAAAVAGSSGGSPAASSPASAAAAEAAPLAATAAMAVPHPDTATTIEHLTQLLPRPAPISTIAEEPAAASAPATAPAAASAAAPEAVGSPATGRSQHVTPFATHHVILEPAAPAASASSQAAATAAGAGAAPAARQPSVPTSQSFTMGRTAAAGGAGAAGAAASPGADGVGSSSLRSWLSRVRSAGHGAGGGLPWPVPLGLGSSATLTPLQSLRGSLRRLHGNLQLSEGGGSGSPSAMGGAGHAGSAGGGAAPRRGHGHAHHVAFAAGLAAATSTAVAVSSVGGGAVSGFVGAATAATSAAAASVAALSTASAAVQLGGHAIEAGSDMLLNRVQGKAVKKASALVADAVLGPAASAGLRHVLLQRLRATVAGASVAWFMMNHMALSDGLVHLDFEHDFVHSAKLMLDLATSGPQVLENCRELMQIGVALTMGMANSSRGSAASSGGGAATASGTGATAAAATAAHAAADASHAASSSLAEAVAAEAATAVAAGELAAGELAVAAAAVAVAAGGAAASAAGGLLAEVGSGGGGAALQEALQGALHNIEGLRDGSFGRPR